MANTSARINDQIAHLKKLLPQSAKSHQIECNFGKKSLGTGKFFYFFSDNPVILHNDGTWTTDTIFSYPKDASQINVVMITEEEGKKLQKKASEGPDFPKFKDVPENSYKIIASRKIKIVE
jgi:hypothetical protein